MIGLIIVISLISLIGVGIGYIEIITRILRKCGCHRISDFCFRCCKKAEEPEPPKEEKVYSFVSLCLQFVYWISLSVRARPLCVWDK